MVRLRALSGGEVVRILGEFGFEVVSQRGSHLKLRRVAGGETQALTVPNHRELDRGTMQAILRQASRFVEDGALRGRFYSE